MRTSRASGKGVVRKRVVSRVKKRCVYKQKQMTTPLSSTSIALFVGAATVYVALNVLGTVYYTKVNRLTNISFNENAWDLSSVLLGWLIFPLFNLSSPISYAVHKPGSR